MRKLFSLGLALGFVTAAGSAAAQYPPPPPPPGGGYGYGPPGGFAPPQQRFGDAGQLVISNDANVGFTGQSTSNNGGSTWNLTLEPALDYF
ncbi:MAG TPA: hypothetical protein VIY73_19390, partial [Polyangiaceae bacterium]